jgi:hypothetical protein
MKILHCFADTGVECEALSAYGAVTRVGIDPTDNPFTDELIACDARELSFNRTFDLGVFHPPCQKWAVGSYIEGNPEERHDNLLPVARDLGREYCDNWIIENVPQAPLHQPITLNGGMFGLPLHYERAFETSYHVAQPRQQTRLAGPGGFKHHHANGGFQGSKELWKSAKGYSHDWPSRPLKRSAIPRAYLNYLIRPLL